MGPAASKLAGYAINKLSTLIGPAAGKLAISIGPAAGQYALYRYDQFKFICNCLSPIPIRLR